MTLDRIRAALAQAEVVEREGAALVADLMLAYSELGDPHLRMRASDGVDLIRRTRQSLEGVIARRERLQRNEAA